MFMGRFCLCIRIFLLPINSDVPSYPVGKPYIYDVRKNSVSLSWCAPHCDGGSAITSYAIDVLEGTSGTWNQIASDCRVSC